MVDKICADSVTDSVLPSKNAALLLRVLNLLRTRSIIPAPSHKMKVYNAMFECRGKVKSLPWEQFFVVVCSLHYTFTTLWRKPTRNFDIKGNCLFKISAIPAVIHYRLMILPYFVTIHSHFVLVWVWVTSLHVHCTAPYNILDSANVASSCRSSPYHQTPF